MDVMTAFYAFAGMNISSALYSMYRVMTATSKAQAAVKDAMRQAKVRIAELEQQVDNLEQRGEGFEFFWQRDDLTEDKLWEIVMWIKENHDEHMSWGGQSIIGGLNFLGRAGHFLWVRSNDKNAAVLFKLTWGGSK